MTVSRLQPYATTIFAETSALATQVGAVNLGQGFPDEDGPASMLEVACQAIHSGYNQYPPGLGYLQLRQAIATQRFRKFHLTYDPETEILVTAGATEAIASAILGLVEPGSDVVVIEPFYDSYSPVIAMAGCHRIAVPLAHDGHRFYFDAQRLEQSITAQTRALIINSPHNPTGMVLTQSECELIAEIACRHDLLVIVDEVYEQLVFDGRQHIPLASIAGMAHRTITISGAAKMFNCTGWKIGWVCASAPLIAGIRAAKQYLTYSGGAPFQFAVADALNHSDEWVDQLRSTLQHRRDILSTALKDIGFDVYDSQGTYFLCVDPRPLGYRYGNEFCQHLIHHIGVAAIPLSAFCCNEHSQFSHLVRFTFVKSEETLHEGIRRLRLLQNRN